MNATPLKNELALIKEMFSGDVFKGRVMFDEPMKFHTSLGIGGPADVLTFPEDSASLKHVMKISRGYGVPFISVGKGTNIIVKDRGIRGIVICLTSFDDMEFGGDGVTINASAGQMLQGLISLSRAKGLSGIEGLSGIPGTLGGAIAGNAGAFGFEIKDVLVNVTMMDKEGDIKVLNRNDIAFGYRKADIPSSSVITRAVLRMSKDDPRDVSRRIDEYLSERRRTQPLGQRSAGCVFKNPPGISAGKLIDEAGLKGTQIGGIEVSNVHGNFFINRGNGISEEFLRLIDIVAQKVKERFGIVLELEVRIL